MSLSRREALKRLGLAGAAALLPVPRGVGAAGVQAVRIGVRSGSFSSWPVLLAAAAGYFEQAGAPVEIRTYHDAPSVALFLARGDLELGVLPPPLFYSVHLGTGPFAGRARPLVAYQVALTDGSAVIVPAESDVRYSRQFRDRTIAVTCDFGMPKLLTDIYLQQSGLTPGQDTGWALWEPGHIRSAFRSPGIGGVALEGWLPTEMVRSGEARVMVPLHKLWTQHPADLLAAGADFHRTRADELRRIAQATLRAALGLERGEVEPLAQVAGSARDGLNTWAEARETSHPGYDPFPYLSAARVVLEEMKKRSQTPLNTDLKKVAEETLLTDLCRSAMREVGFGAIPADDSRDERMIGCCYTFF